MGEHCPCHQKLRSQKREDWFSFRVERAHETNPLLIQNLVATGYAVVKLEEIYRSLESVYLQAVNQGVKTGGGDVD